MVYAPFGSSKKSWPSVKAYQTELNAFRKANKGFPFAEVNRMWFSKPEHMGEKLYAEYSQRLKVRDKAKLIPIQPTPKPNRKQRNPLRPK